MKRILIDGRFVGVGESQTRYVLELVRNILKLDKKNEYTLLIRPQGKKELKYFPKIEGVPNLKVKVLDIQHYSLAEQIKLLRWLNKEKYDLVHFTQFNQPIFYRGKHVTTIQDLTMQGHLHRQKFYRRLAFRMVMGAAAKKSNKIIAITKKTQEEVMDFYHTPSDKFVLIYHGLDHNRFNIKVKDNKTAIDRFKKKYKIDEEYFLYTGMWKRHKNVLRMLKAFEKFKTKNKESKIKLVFVGKIDKKEPEVIAEIDRINNKLNPKFSSSNSIITTGFVEEDEIQLAYAGAKAYVMPSLNEGFGWPPLEAMGSGTPVISSDESCMPEVLGDAPIYFDPYDIDDMADKMKEIASADSKTINKLIQKGLTQANKYHWSEAARKTLNLYKEMLNIK